MSTVTIGTLEHVDLLLGSVELLAGTAQKIASPVNGFVDSLEVTVQVAVTTGGVIAVQGGSDGVTAVTGATVTVANAAVAGTQYNATVAKGEATAKVTKGQLITLSVDAAFATAGEVNVSIRFRSEA